MKYVRSPIIGSAAIVKTEYGKGLSKYGMTNAKNASTMNVAIMITENAALADFPVISASLSSSFRFISGITISLIRILPLFRFFDR